MDTKNEANLAELPIDPPLTSMSPRDKIRQAVLDSKPEDTIISVFGVEIEVRAPDLEGLLQYRGAQDDDSVMARSIINTCYVPGTDEPVFEETDVNVIMKQKFSQDMKKLIKTINKILGDDNAVAEGVKEQTFSDSE